LEALLIPSSTSVGKLTVAAEFSSTDAGCSTPGHQSLPTIAVGKATWCLQLLAIGDQHSHCSRIHECLLALSECADNYLVQKRPPKIRGTCAIFEVGIFFPGRSSYK